MFVPYFWSHKNLFWSLLFSPRLFSQASLCENYILKNAACKSLLFSAELYRNPLMTITHTLQTQQLTNKELLQLGIFSLLSVKRTRFIDLFIPLFELASFFLLSWRNPNRKYGAHRKDLALVYRSLQAKGCFHTQPCLISVLFLHYGYLALFFPLHHVNSCSKSWKINILEKSLDFSVPPTPGAH